MSHMHTILQMEKNKKNMIHSQARKPGNVPGNVISNKRYSNGNGLFNNKLVRVWDKSNNSLIFAECFLCTRPTTDHGSNV